jgi:radical SAM protein with 4Fe4S-binding SPASM domain
MKNIIQYLKNDILPQNADNERVFNKYKLEELLYCYALKNNMRLDSPTIVGLDITRKCNLKCKHCFVTRSDYSNELSTEEIFKLLNDLKEMNVYQIYIMGGEPFCRDDIIDIIKHIKSLQMTVSINTNGTLITEEQVSILSNIFNIYTDWVQVSLDGAKAETHDSIRKKGAFDTTISNIKKLCENKVPIRINMVVSDFNIKEMVDVYKLASVLGINRINFNPIYTYKNNTDYRMPTFDEYFNAFEDVLRYHYEIESPIIIQQDPLCIPFSHSQLEKYYLNNELIIPQFNCRAGIYSFEVDPAGKVYPCSFLHGEEFLAGDIRKNSISEIWTNNANWENTILSKRKNGKCSNCTFFERCLGGCIAASYDFTGDICMPDPRCNYFKNEKYS